MDERLIPADPLEVKRLMARAYLDSPAIVAEQGEIRLAPHQVDAASRLLRLSGEHGGAVLADATGLGKTFVAIAVARVMGPALIVAPAALRSMWRESLLRTGVDAQVESYEALSRGGRRSGKQHALLVLDEAHHARNPGAKRYAALADLAWGAKVLLLTATPVHNRGRDLRALLALFLGSRADSMPDDEVRGLMVRRTSSSENDSLRLPSVGNPEWLAVPTDPDTLHAIRSLPPAVPAADGGVAHALLLLGLVRAWSSSEAALRATLRRRLRSTATIAAALESGRLPDRRELASWPVFDDAIQLGFPGLFDAHQSRADLELLKERLARHEAGVRAVLDSLDRTNGATDAERARLLACVRERHAPTPVVAFTQFADSAAAAFRACMHAGGVAVVTGRGARIASGRVHVEEIVRGFDDADRVRSPHAMPLDLLIATDVLSEGLSLRRAGVIVHLDLPWTMARLEQRVGRLRRMGSPHQHISVYAIGPPVEARELVPVIRALQRKTRLVAGVIGLEELDSALPLLGERLTRATKAISQRDEVSATENLRRAIGAWLNAPDASRRCGSDAGAAVVALGMIDYGSGLRLIAVNGSDVSDRPVDLLRVVQSPPSAAEARASPSPGALIAIIEQWLEEDRGRLIARPATDSPSRAHVAVLRALQLRLTRASRLERVGIVKRVEVCRDLVLSARGIGAELALARFAGQGISLDLDALEKLLAARVQPVASQPRQARLVALVWHSGGGQLALLQQGSTFGSPHPGPPRSSSHRETRGAMRG